MNITRNNVDALNAIITVEVAKADYAPQVDKILRSYSKTAAVPGFRKGAVPFGMIQKQYGKAVLLEEVNKVLQENLNRYLQQEKLDILGNPLPKINEDFNWDADDYKFEFELGLAPTFDVDFRVFQGVDFSVEGQIIVVWGKCAPLPLGEVFAPLV